jgi:hypothetical protein
MGADFALRADLGADLGGDFWRRFAEVEWRLSIRSA